MTDINLRTHFDLKDIILKQVDMIKASVEKADFDKVTDIQKIQDHIYGVDEILQEKLQLIEHANSFEERIQNLGRSQHPRVASTKRSKSIREAAKSSAEDTNAHVDQPTQVELVTTHKVEVVSKDAPTTELTEIEKKTGKPFKEITIGDLVDKEPEDKKDKLYTSNILKSSVEGISGSWSSFNGVATITISADKEKFPDSYELVSAKYMEEELEVTGTTNFTIEDLTITLQEKGIEFDISDFELTLLDLVSRQQLQIKFA